MGSISAEPQVILFDYQFAPNAQKARNLLNACGIQYKSCEQPFVKPRPILTKLGIDYRRIPVIAIGKDVYCDNRVFLEAVQKTFKDKALPQTPADHAYESFGYRTFWAFLPLVDEKLITPDMSKDRSELFTVFTREDFGTLRPNSLAEFKHFLDIVENDFLAGGGPWIGGEKCGIADIHASWMIKWALQTLPTAKEPGISSKEFPKVFKWIEGLPDHVPENECPHLSADDASEQVLSAQYAVPEIGVDPHDPTGLKAGTSVHVMTNDDAKPDANPQKGKLIGLGRREIVIEIENGIRLHFPRIGYVVKQA